jgi:hypothetical protein
MSRRRRDRRREEEQEEARYERGLAVLQAEHASVRRKLEELKPAVPPAPDAAGVERSLRALARQAGVAAIEVKPVPGSDRMPLGEGRASPLERHRLEVSGRDRYDRVAALLSAAARLPRLIVVERLHLKAESGNQVGFTARLALPVDTGWPPAPSPSPSPRHASPARAALAARFAVLEQSLRNDKLLVGLLQDLVARGRRAPALFDALAAVSRGAGGRALLAEATVARRSSWRESSSAHRRRRA